MFTLVALALLATPPVGMARVGPGVLERAVPAPKQAARVELSAFLLDVHPVTNAEYLDFVTARPEWRKGAAPALFADLGYLGAWRGPLELGVELQPRAPVTRVSWFAARAYCEWRGARLPTTDEWEFAAQAGEREIDGRKDPAFTQRILDWYARKTPAQPAPVGRGRPNRWGVHDLHGLVWEWVEDFGAALVSSDNRAAGEQDVVRFCGGGAQNARDPADYASFMRLAFRSSLEARYTTQNLGFRCAKDQPSRRKEKP